MGLFAKRCPYCRSTNIQFMNQDRKNFNGCVGCIGFLISWPLVLLGLVGKNGKTTGTVITAVEPLKVNNFYQL